MYCHPTPPNDTGLAPMSKGMRVRLVSTAVIFMAEFLPNDRLSCVGMRRITSNGG